MHNNSATLIDNIFTKCLDDYIASGNVVSDLTDHFSQFCILQSYNRGKQQPIKIFVRDYSNFSEHRFLHDLSLINWNLLLSGDDVNKLFGIYFL